MSRAVVAVEVVTTHAQQLFHEQQDEPAPPPPSKSATRRRCTQHCTQIATDRLVHNTAVVAVVILDIGAFLVLL